VNNIWGIQIVQYQNRLRKVFSIHTMLKCGNRPKIGIVWQFVPYIYNTLIKGRDTLVCMFCRLKSLNG